MLTEGNYTFRFKSGFVLICACGCVLLLHKNTGSFDFIDVFQHEREMCREPQEVAI